MSTPDPSRELPAAPEDWRGIRPEAPPVSSAELVARVTASTYVPPPWPARVAAHIPLRISVRRAARGDLAGLAWRAALILLNLCWWLSAAFLVTWGSSALMRPGTAAGCWEAVILAVALAAAVQVRCTWRSGPGTV